MVSCDINYLSGNTSNKNIIPKGKIEITMKKRNILIVIINIIIIINNNNNNNQRRTSVFEDFAVPADHKEKINGKGLHDLVVEVLDCQFVVYEFELQSRLAFTFGKV